MTHLIIEALEILFENNRDLSQAQWQKAYMRHQFAFYGISKPVRARLEKEIFAQYCLDTEQKRIAIIMLLWEKEQREFQYAACRLAYYSRQSATPNLLRVYEHMLRTKSWWDTVDEIAIHLVGSLVYKHKELVPILDQWVTHDCLWMRRTALLYQIRWKEQTDEQRLFAYCKTLAHEKEFFIRKAIGWALREYSKIKPEAVARFINTHRTLLSNISIKEGSKYLYL